MKLHLRPDIRIEEINDHLAGQLVSAERRKRPTHGLGLGDGYVEVEPQNARRGRGLCEIEVTSRLPFVPDGCLDPLRSSRTCIGD